MNDRLTKHDLKDDVLVTQTARTADFMTHHARSIIGAAAVVLVIVVAVTFMRTSALRSEDRAAGLLSEATVEYATGNYAAASVRLDDLFRSAGGTSSAKRAVLLQGDVQYAQGAYQQASETFEKALKDFAKDPVMSVTARQGLAASLENLGQNGRAAELYAELADSAPNRVLKAEYQLSQARNLMLSGRAGEAMPILEAVSTSRDNPRAAQTAKLRLAEARLVGTAG